jgi:ATP-binding cassette subfamily B protein
MPSALPMRLPLPPPKGSDPLLSKLLRAYLPRYRNALLAVLALQTVQTVAALALPSLNARIIDKGVRLGDHAYIWRTGVLMLAITLVQICFSVGAVWFGSKASMRFGRDLRGDLFHQVTGYSAREVAHFGAPSLITRITNDVQQVQMLVLMTCTLLVAAPITAVGGVIMALREDVGLSWLLVVSIPVLLLIVGTTISRMIPQFRLMQDRIDSINRILREQLTGIRVVRAFVREPQERRRFAAANDDVTETALKAGRLQALMFPTVIAIVNVSSVGVVWFGADRINRGEMSIGAMIAFLTYLTQILMAVMMATFMAALVPRAAVSAERIEEVLMLETSVVIALDAAVEVDKPGTIEFRHVGFQYPGAESPVLDDVSFVCAKGTTTAVIGSTGSGKTTLVSLAARLFDVTSGAVLLGDVDVRALGGEAVWSRVGLVPQKPYLFSGTVASNLRYGRPEATDEEMWEALSVAQAEDFVRAMPGGLDASIAQGGANVSGGQRQRLAIARALVKRPEIYLFDDSFSALDLATDARLRAALAPQVADAAVIVVAQRVSSIRNADQILVLEGGRVVGLGRHEDLLTDCSTYAEIVSSQMSAEEAA